MAIERTFSILKPDATARNLTGAINAMIEQAGLRIIAQKRVMISRPQAEAFYAVHRQRPFFGELVDFMISGPVVVQVLEGENAIAAYRLAIEATPRLEEAHFRLAEAYRQTGETANAQAELQVYAQISKEKAEETEHQRHEVQQFVYELRNPSAPPK